MRAAVIAAPGDVSIEHVRAPEPRENEVLLAVEGCGICGSDLAVWQGRPWFDYPFDPGAPGHEPWGYVAAIGEGVTTVHPGARVAAICHRAHAELDVASADAVIPLPAELDGIPFPGEALGCAANAFRRAEVGPDAVVAVVGVGFLGAAITSFAARTAATVIAISRRSFALDVARMMGASEVIALGDDGGDVLRRVTDLTGGNLCDVVFEAAGHQRTLDVAARLTKVRGRLVIAGYHQDAVRTVEMQMWNWRGLDVINAHERELSAYVDGVRTAVAAAAGGDLDLGPLMTHRFTLDNLGDALDASRERPDGFLKGWVEP